MEVSPINMRDAAETERAVAAFAREPNGGLIVTSSAVAQAQRDLIVSDRLEYVWGLCAKSN
jgi:hypothetical protein